MISFVRSKPEVIVATMANISTNGLAWSLEEKRRLIYPLTERLLGCGINKRRTIAELLAKQNGDCGYSSVSLKLAGSSLEPLIFLPLDTFDPSDPWSVIFREALAKLNFSDKSVCEIGPGSGSVAIELINLPNPPAKITLIEIDSHVLSVARLNIEMVCHERILEHGIELEYFEGDAAKVLESLPATDKNTFDYVIGCIPQVPAEPNELGEWQNIAHEYDGQVHCQFHHWGLGLIHDVLFASVKHLPRAGSMVFVHSGRVPEAIRNQLHKQLGLNVKLEVANKMVAHCPTTSLEYLFEHQGDLLFSDAAGCCPVTPEEAEQIRQRAVAQNPHCHDCGIYHRILVVQTVAKTAYNER